MIIQIADAVSVEDCRRLMTMYDRHVDLTEVRDYTGHPVVYWPQFCDAADAAELVPSLIKECLRHIGAGLELEDSLYPETVILAAIGAEGTIVDTRTIVGKTNKANGSPIIRLTGTYRRFIISMTSSTAAKSSSSGRN